MPVLLVLVALSAQDVDHDRLERFKRIPAEELGRAYLINENTLHLLAMARQGVTLHLSGDDSARTVTSANADSVAAEYERRRATYAAAIRARGFKAIAGEYEITLARCPAASKVGAVLVTLTQREFIVDLPWGAGGVVVEGTLVVGEGDGSDGSYRSGAIGERKTELRPFQGGGCGSVLTPYRRPDVRLERPESLIGSWEGRWDEEFGVRFTITPTDSGYTVRYEWQEYRGGAYQTETYAFHPSSKRSIRGGPMEIVAERDREYGARVVGHFVKTRTAKLKRVSGR